MDECSIKDYSINNNSQIYRQIRFGFLRNTNLYLFSAEYDATNDLLYLYISYLELVKLLNRVIKWQTDAGYYLKYIWDIPANISQEECLAIHNHFQEIDYYLADVRYGDPKWCKFYMMNNEDCLPRLSWLPNPDLHGKDKFDDQYKIYRKKELAFISYADFYYLIGAQENLNLPLWEH